MVWYLVLAHLLGDFVLQTDWMVRRRDDLRVLTLHAGIHFTLMFLLIGAFRSDIWPYLLLLALIHLGQDRLKNNITNRRPDWTKPFFVIDQVLHFAAIFLFVFWLQKVSGILPIPGKPELVMIAIAFLFISYVWFIVERIFNLSNVDYLQDLNSTKFPRMLTRVGLVSLFLLIRLWLTSGLAILFSNPYPQKKFRQRAVLTDISVALIAIFFLFWALG
jgi:hypothetical protein